MKNTILTICLLVSTFIFSQENDLHISHIDIEKSEITVNSIDEIETINWKDLKEAFKENNPESDVSIQFNLNKIKSKNLKMNYFYKVAGKAKNIDSLVTELKSGIKSIEKRLKNKNN